MHHKHLLAICLIISAVLFVVISIGMVSTSFSKIAVICGMVLVFLMACGFFYATLHLSKFNVQTEQSKTSNDSEAVKTTESEKTAESEKPEEKPEVKPAESEKPEEKPAESSESNS